MRMSSGDDLTHKRRFQIGMLNIVGRHMSLYMMHSHKRKPFRKSDGLCLRNADQKRTHKSRTIRDRDSANIVKSYVCFLQRHGYYLIYLFNMLS